MWAQSASVGATSHIGNLQTFNVNAKCVVAEDPRLQFPLHEIELTQFSNLEDHLVHTGDSMKQEVHVKKVRTILSKKRSECEAP